VTRVHFEQEVVSDVFIIREKYARHEIPDLFYTHDESIQFTSDYNRESIKAEALGLTWSEWWELRCVYIDVNVCVCMYLRVCIIDVYDRIHIHIHIHINITIGLMKMF
jgi:hypothetical protein